MSAKPLVVVVGADGFVGGGLAQALNAKNVVCGPGRNGDLHIKPSRNTSAVAASELTQHV